MALNNLQGILVVITGAGSGIGRATALAFARRGARIVAADLQDEALQRLTVEFGALGAECYPLRLDVSDEQAVREFAAAVVDHWGIPHVLVNCAGIAFLGRFLDGDLQHWRKVLDVNLMGVAYLCHAFLPHMIGAGDARHVLNVASSAGNYPSPSMAAYAASKAAVVNFSEVLKMELADTRVRVSTICPGIINTPIVSSRNNATSTVPAGQLARLSNYYQRQGCAPSVVAEAMVRAVQRDQDLVLTGPAARLVYWLRRLSLRLTRRLTLRYARRIGYLPD